jgi:hypothetical protein
VQRSKQVLTHMLALTHGCRLARPRMRIQPASSRSVPRQRSARRPRARFCGRLRWRWRSRPSPTAEWHALRSRVRRPSRRWLTNEVPASGRAVHRSLFDHSECERTCGCRECHPGTQSLQDPGPIHSEDAGKGGRTSQTPDANGPASGAMAFVIAVGSLTAAGGD